MEDVKVLAADLLLTNYMVLDKSLYLFIIYLLNEQVG